MVVSVRGVVSISAADPSPALESGAFLVPGLLQAGWLGRGGFTDTTPVEISASRRPDVN